MRKSSAFLLALGSEVLLAGLFLGHARLSREGDAASLARTGEVVRRLGLTDLALFNEARYTRHLSQADLHTAFQDHPCSIEHFPSGSLVRPHLLHLGEEP